MATDYDAPRKSAEDETDSIEALKERRSDNQATSIDVDESDNSGFELAGADLSNVELDVVVVPQQDNEFTCMSCFIVRHQSQLDHQGEFGPVCRECAD